MKLVEEFNPIRKWAESKGIYQSGDIKTQTLKLIEEAGELARACLKDDKEEFIDAIGDCVIVLVSIAELGSTHFNDSSITLEECTNTAYKVIVDRRGKMNNGTFVKNE